MICVELLFDAIDRFDQVILIAAREGHARDGKLNGNQRLMYCGLLRPIHGPKFELVCQKPQAPKQKPRLGRGFRNASRYDRYLAGGVDEEVSVVDFLCLLLLLVLLLLWLFL